MITSMENWTIIPDSNNRYEITENGNVRRLGRKILSPKTKSNGYKELSLHYENQKPKMEYVHRLVAKTFIGEIPNLHEVNHIDGNKANNNISNLEIVTPSENRIHSYKVLGNKTPLFKGEDHPNSKFKNSDIFEIRSLYSKGITLKEIAIKYKRPYSTICKICYRKTWNHI